MLAFDASSLRSHIVTGIATSKRSADTLSHSLFLFSSALSKQRARAREKHVTPNKVISDTKEKTRTSAQMMHSKSLGISSPKLIDRAWCAFIIISAFADCSSSSRCWCSSKCDGAMPIVVQREVVVFLFFFPSVLKIFLTKIQNIVVF